MTTPQRLTLAMPHLRMQALAWGPEDGRLALCLHGFPDSAWGWRKVAPLLADSGFRVVAPFTRGYSPTRIPADGDYSIGALMYDALAVHRHLGGDPDAILIGHDWGAFTANAMAGYPDSPFAAHVAMSVPAVPAMSARPRPLRRALPLVARQLRMSWYAMFFQLPYLPQRLAPRVIPRLWRAWEPAGFPVDDEIANALDALPTRSHRRAAIEYYRALGRPWRATAYCELNAYSFALPQVPVLHLQGDADGALHIAYCDFLAEVLPAGSRVVILRGAGHFLQLERPATVHDAVVGFVGAP